MEINQKKSIIEAILFAAGRPVTKNELILALEISAEDIDSIIKSMQEEYKKEDRGIEFDDVPRFRFICRRDYLISRRDNTYHRL